MIKPWTIRLQQWKQLDSSETSWLHAPNYKVNSQRRETFCWQNLFLRGTFLTVGGGVVSGGVCQRFIFGRI